MRIGRRQFLAAAVAALAPGASPRSGLPGSPARALVAPRSELPGSPAHALVAQRPVPSPSQLLWQQDELALFLHFGVNTFTDREWGDGTESPSVFNPSALDARQWARTTRMAGFRAMILTAKHHDGFCLWPTRTTTHSVAASPFRGGAGDVVREFTDACRAEGLRAGLYLSPWDRNAASYGDSPRYDDFYCDQLTELLTRYGPVHEVWFDGANGEGPNGRRQTYDWQRYWRLVRRLQPDAVMFSDAGPDIRWIGNENGVAGDPNWSTVDPAVVPFPGMSQQGIDMLLHGDPRGAVWRPGEADVSIRPGWFYHTADDARVKTVDQLVDLYFASVGRNAKLLLNVPPTPAGLLHSIDAERLLGMRRQLDTLFADDRSAAVRAGRDATVSIADLHEDIARGQSVSRYELSGLAGGAWRVLTRGTTIGHRKLDRFAPVSVSGVRLTVQESVGEAGPVTVRLY